MKTWKSTTAGVLEIVAGSLQIGAAAIIALAMGLGAGAVRIAQSPAYEFLLALPLVLGIAAVLLVLGIIAVVGGVNALQRKRWGLALAGGICALLPLQTLLGILAIVFVAISRDEFN
jgi:hypothetical protein